MASFTIKGIYRDVLKDSSGLVEYDSGWVSNTIVERCHILLAALMKDPSAAMGAAFLAVGSGDEAWDDRPDGPPDPATTEEDLKNRYIGYDDEENRGMLALGSEAITYYGGDDGNPTSSLEITATLNPGYPKVDPNAVLRTYPLREFGLFGKIADEPYMINCVRHPVIHKDETATLIRVIRLYF